MLILVNIIEFLIIVVPVLIAVAYLTLAERKIMSLFQRRKGPNLVGPLGILQPFADALKLMIKEIIIPLQANKKMFILAPIITLCFSLLGWVLIPLKENAVVADIDVSVLFTLLISALGVYGIVIAGWSSRSKYALLGAIRSAAQMISYEVSLGLIIIATVIVSGSLNYVEIVMNQEKFWNILSCFPLLGMFYISAIAETNRPPFDLPEAEAELVAGYSTEYSGIGFAMFYMGEYANIILISTITVLFFLGGWWGFLLFNQISFVVKLSLLLIGFVWVRVAFPRFRYDQLMRLGWIVFLPVGTGMVLFNSGLIYGLNL